MVYYAMKDEYQILLLLLVLIIVNSSSNNHIRYHTYVIIKLTLQAASLLSQYLTPSLSLWFSMLILYYK
jgi:hypothetical protein